MSAIKYAIDRITREIPHEVLHLAFLRKTDYFSVQTSLEQQITDLVLHKILLRDLNVIGGMEVTISLDKCKVTYYEKNPTNHNMVIYVPYDITNNKKIVEPLSLAGNVTFNGNYNSSTNPLISGMNNIIGHRASIGNKYITSNLELIAPNTILVYEETQTLFNGYLKVILENNNNLTNISPRSYLALGKAAVLATKLFIYNAIVIDMDKGVLYNGHELGKIADVINSYESALEDYNTYIEEKMGKIMFMNDKPSMSNL